MTVMETEHPDDLLYNTLEDVFNMGYSIRGVHVVCALCSHVDPVFEFGPAFNMPVARVSDMYPKMRDHVRAKHNKLRFLDGRG